MTKFVFAAVIAVLAFALYSIPSHSKDEGPSQGAGAAPAAPAPTPGASGQIQEPRKAERSRTAQRKTERTKTPQAPVEQPKTDVTK